MKKLLFVFTLIFGLILTGCDSNGPVTIDNPDGTFVSDTPVELSPNQVSAGQLIITVSGNGSTIGVTSERFEIDAFDFDFENPGVFFRFDVLGVNHAVPYRFDGEYSESGNQIRAEITNSNMDFRKVIVFERTN